MAKKDKKYPKTARDITSSKTVRTKVNTESANKEKPVWQLSLMDSDHDWGWDKIGKDRWVNEILPKLSHFESMTWDEILKASGGRTRGNNNHPVQVGSLIKKAQKRLCDIGQDDIEELFSLRLEGQTRVYGIRQGRVMKLLWFDFNHEIYTVTKRNT